MRTGPASSEETARRLLALQPLHNGAVRLLGQVAGLLLLANAGGDPDRQREHLAAARRRRRELQEAIGSDASFSSRTGDGVARSLERLGALLDRLERRYAQSRRDEAELALLLGELAGIRRLLQESSCPRHGLALVDFSGACCAGRH